MNIPLCHMINMPIVRLPLISMCSRWNICFKWVIKRQQNVLCLSHELEGGGGICCISHPQVGRSLEGCECIIWRSVKHGWKFVKAHWENVFCVGRQPSATSLDALYLKSSPGWPLLAHCNGFHHAKYKRGPRPPPHYNDRHEQGWCTLTCHRCTHYLLEQRLLQ